MPATKPRPRVGDTVWAVEWCSEIPLDEYGDADTDNAVTHVRHFQTQEAARQFAVDVLPKDVYGSVAVWPREFVAYDDSDAIRYPHAGFWEDTADAEYILAD